MITTQYIGDHDNPIEGSKQRKLPSGMLHVRNIYIWGMYRVNVATVNIPCMEHGGNIAIESGPCVYGLPIKYADFP